MSTTTVKTIGSTGDYTTVQAWEDASPADLTTSISGGEIWEGQCQNQTFDGAGNPVVTISGSTTSANGYKHLTTASGASFRDNPNVQTNALRYNTSNGAALTTDGYVWQTVIISEGFARVSKLQIANTNAGGASKAVLMSNASIVLTGLIIEVAGSTGSNGGVVHGSNSSQVLNNCLFVMRGSGASKLVQMAFAPTIVNCTFVVPSDKTAATTGIFISYPSGSVIKNCAIFGATTASSTTGVTFTTCYSDDASPPSGMTNTAYATGSGAQFQNITDATRDFRIKTGSSLKDAGTTDSTYGTPDIAGTSRPSGSSYDVGCWEFVSSAAAFIARNITVRQAVNRAGSY